jgi:acyl-CoA reductase-like NAD-dependent aldehyde dehydrogenase
MGLLTLIDSLCDTYLRCDVIVVVATFYLAYKLLAWMGQDMLTNFASTPKVTVPAEEDERCRKLEGKRKFDYAKEWGKSTTSVPCWDPATMDYLGELPAHSPDDVRKVLAKARTAQRQWATSPFAQRRQFLRVLQSFILENAETLAVVACRESGKTMIDAMVGEITVTLEKLRWTTCYGEGHLLPEYRDSGLMNLHKTSRVEWLPIGVVGAIVPWNYPFHNVFNPLIASLFSGNAIVIKVSEFACWSTKYYGRVIQACLRAVGAPVDLVQFVIGYSEAGTTLVEGADKVIFVGSVGVGRKVMEAASKTLTPVILELGGKDPFIVCDDVDPKPLAQLVVRGAYQNMGQNCAGPERFIVYDKIYDEFCEHVSNLVKTMKQGPPLSTDLVDCGACVHPPSLENYKRLVDDAVAKGARVLAGGKRNSEYPLGQFFQPTVLADVTEDMLIASEETFGPILSIFRVKGNSDEEAIRLANNCSFALSSCAHSADQKRAAKICARLEAGMSSVNDIEGTTYLSQSLPFGGFKDSGFGRFAGPEGLRGLSIERSIVENRASFLKPSIPRAIAYPANGQGTDFCLALNKILYGQSVTARLKGVFCIIRASLPVKGHH